MSIDVQILRKIHLEKKYQGQIFQNWVGGPHSQGLPKSQKVLRWIDRGSRDLFNGVKILALRSAKLKINGVKLLLSKKY